MFVLSHPKRVFERQHGPQGLVEADLGFRAFWVVPSGPFKAEAFWNFQGKRGFASAGESCECEY